jgi:uncharacterized protein YycO
MKVYIVCTLSQDLIGKIVGKFGVHWNHIAIMYKLYSTSEWRIFESGSFGIVNRSFIKFISNKSEYSVFKLQPEMTLSAYEKRVLLAFCWGNVGKPYNYFWMLRVAWRVLKKWWVVKILKQSIAYIYPAHVCSSLVYTAFKYVGIDLALTTKHIWVLPDDIATSPHLRPVRDPILSPLIPRISPIYDD